MAKIDYKDVMKEATEAAERAGNAWLRAAMARGPAYVVVDDFEPDPKKKIVGSLLDSCGFSYPIFRDKRTGFAKWYKKENGERDLYNVRLRTINSMRQELGLAEAETRAALEVFNKYGIKGLGFYSRID
jgi:hypothetical protein